MNTKHFLFALLISLLAACSDDATTTRDGGSGTDQQITSDATTTDATTSDGGVSSDGSAKTDGAPSTDGHAPSDTAPHSDDATVTDAKPPGPSFDVELTLTFPFWIACNASDTNKDCKGNVYWAAFDSDPTPPASPTPLLSGGPTAAQKGTVLKLIGVPVKSKVWLSAFMDDNNNVDPKNIGPDKGDPVLLTAPLSPKAGDKLKLSQDFLIRYNP
ncbi:MAG: hypothetical protein H6707_20820 [Deltaproteobacteria bacterium]|nr:hypothetical protein [Deltaproteobacteria bacterium]